MNDRFKFRVWSYEYNRFIEDGSYPIGSDYFLVICQDGELLKIGLGDYKDYDEHTHDWGTRDEFKNATIIFCTGLKDKNGKLIYEGDIVTDVLANKFIVNFSIEYSSFLLTNIKTKESMVFYPKVKLEVIGNQFENPELLEEQCANQLNKG